MKALENKQLSFNQPLKLTEFYKIGHDKDPISLNDKRQLTAGKSWKGRIVSMLETVGIFKKYCTDFREQEVARSRNTAWKLSKVLEEKYGARSLHAALENTKQRFHGMDEVRFIKGIDLGMKDQETLLTCGEARSVINEAAAVSKFLELHPKPQTCEMGTQTDAPNVHEVEIQTELLKELKPLKKLSPKATQHSVSSQAQTGTTTAAQSTPNTVKAPLSNAELITDPIKKHSLAKDFVKDESKLQGILKEMGASPEKLTSSRAEYVASHVLKEVHAQATDKELTENDLHRMAKHALETALKHSSAWNRVEAIKIGTEKHLHSTDSNFKADTKALSSEVKKNAKEIITRDFITKVAQKKGISLNDAQTKFAMKEAISSAAYTAEKQGVMLGKENFKELAEIKIDEVKGKSRARLLAGF